MIRESLFAALEVAAPLVLIGVPALMMLVVAWGLLTGRIPLGGVLTEKATGHGEISPNRVLLLLASLGFGVYAMVRMLGGEALAIPVPSDLLLSLFGGSNALYLSGKYLGHARSKG